MIEELNTDGSIEVVDIWGPDEVWIIETTTSIDRLDGRFIANVLGKPLYFQTTARRIIFMTWIVSAQRESDNARNQRRNNDRP